MILSLLTTHVNHIFAQRLPLQIKILETGLALRGVTISAPPFEYESSFQSLTNEYPKLTLDGFLLKGFV